MMVFAYFMSNLLRRLHNRVCVTTDIKRIGMMKRYTKIPEGATLRDMVKAMAEYNQSSESLLTVPVGDLIVLSLVMQQPATDEELCDMYIHSLYTQPQPADE